jgi:hypothetical protein
VCSVRSLYRAFPPLDPPVYVRPQLKPSHGICLFSTTTFGAHRVADQGAGRSTSGRDLLHLLGGSTLASSLSTAGILHLPGLTSTHPGRHTAVPNLHRHLRAGARLHRAGIFYIPAGIFYVPASIFYVPAGIFYVLAGIFYVLAGIFYIPGGIFYVPAGTFMSRPAYTGLGSTSAFPGPAYDFPSRNMFFPGRYSCWRASICQLRPL